MADQQFNRRGFLRSAGLAVPAAAVPAQIVMEKPARCWTIMGTNWEFNDEYSYAEGEYATGTLYHSEDEAKAACQKLNDEFYEREDPSDYDYEFLDDVTWGLLHDEQGFSDPFQVQELLQQHEPRNHPR